MSIYGTIFKNFRVWRNFVTKIYILKCYNHTVIFKKRRANVEKRFYNSGTIDYAWYSGCFGSHDTPDTYEFEAGRY